MWFKHCHVSEAKHDFTYQPEKLADALSHHAFSPCSAVVPVSSGFVPPLGNEDEAPLVYAQQGYMLFCLQVQEKILPPAVIKEQHQLKVAELEEKLGKPLSRSEKERIKDELTHTLLGKAFHKTSKTYAYLDVARQMLIVDTSSARRLELFYKVAHPILSQFQIMPFNLQSPSAVLTRWLGSGEYPDQLSILDKATLEDSEEQKGKVSLSRKDLFADSVQRLLEEGSRVTRLGLNWAEKLHFTLKEDFSISGLRFLEEVKDLARDGMAETAEARFAADFFIMAQTVGEFLDLILPEFIDNETEESASEPVVEDLAAVG